MDTQPNPVGCPPWVRPSWTGDLMHASVLEWVGNIVKGFALAEKSVLEVGSADVNGTVRQFFSGPYYGVDIEPGPGVDAVLSAEHVDTLGKFDVVISTEMLEHVAHPWACARSMGDALVHGGIMILTARGYDERGCWEPHGYPEDHWRFSEQSMRTMGRYAGVHVIECTADPEGPGWFLLGQSRR